MKKIWMALALLAAPLAQAAEPAVKLDTDARKAGYVAGYRFGANLQNEANDLDIEAVVKGLRDAYARKTAALPESEHQAAIDAWQFNRTRTQAASNAEASRQYLEANGKRPGVVTLPDGLQYEVLKSGQGPSPKLNDTVQVQYHGTLINGDVFDSSVLRNKPTTFAVDQVIAGWTEALQLMKVGDRWKLFIPPSLAYGDRKMGNKIKPGSALIFEVELLDVTPGATR
ncbi:MAG: hypothetical protein RI907_1126 [Pseudomonadota bacterium]|jgi:FKBP-type peptidyl-prolyl cis-trans isomerase FklB